jgi:uroporphyrinogen-III decarboxylase
VKRTVEGTTITTEWKTPVGSLRQVETELPASYTVAIREHMIKNINDLKTYVYIEEHTTYRTDYGLAARRYVLIGDNGAVLCYLPKSPYMELVALKAGIVAVVDMLSDDPDQFDECLDRLEICADRAARLAVNSPAEFLMIPENISSEVVGKRLYRGYMERYQKKWFREIKRAGKVSFVHMDGTMRGLLREVSEAGADVMEALTPAPTGDIEIEDLKNWTAEGTAIWGGIPGAYFTDSVSDTKFDEYVKRVLDTWTKKPRYVLGVADQVPPYSRPERIMRVRTLVDRYGKF